MNKSSTRGIFLSITLLFSIVVIVIPLNVYAEEINVKSFAFEETTIIEFTNDSNEGVNTFRIWLGSDFNFKSFKTEKEWVGEKTSLGVIIFTSSETIKPGESVKFGVKTDKAKPGINWNALDKEDNQIDTGVALPGELPKVIQNTEPELTEPEPTEPELTEPKQDQIIEDTGPSISAESTFKIVPEKPNVGSSIRVTGDKFGASQEFDFYIDAKKIGSFETDENGHFMTTMKIPEHEIADRVDFIIKNKDGEEKKISLRIGEAESRIPETGIIELTVGGIPDVVHRGDFLEIYGTGEPNSAITAEITTDEGEIINSRTAEIDSTGNWKLDEPIIVALDSPFGKYNATITDGRQSILKQWTVESDKVIIIAPITLKFEQGEIMKFNGTALPNKPIELILEDPLGKEIFSDIIQIDDSGFVEFEFQTALSATKGTYILIATQEKEKEFIFAGIGQLPSIPVNIELDKLNYKTSDTVIITLAGKGSDIVSLLIIDPSDKPIGESVSITLEPDGRGAYSLNLDGYSSGVYTAVISKGNTQSVEIFTVGLLTGSGKIEINTTKINYLPGDSILILGDTSANVLLTVILYDPDGNEVKLKETFSDKSGKISESSFRIPSDAESGIWTINAKSGQNLDIIEIEVLATLFEGMHVSVEKGEKVPTIGETIIIKVFGATQTVTVEIIAEDDEIINTLTAVASSQGEINLPWIIPKDTEPGNYTVKITDAFSSVSTTFEFEIDGNIIPGTESIQEPIPDTLPPVITIPNNIAINATSNNPSPVTFSVTATDDTDGTLTPTCSYNSGDDFPIGVTTVTCDVTDAAGNTESKSFTVTLTYTADTILPVITLTGANPQTIELGAGYIELGATTDDGSLVVTNSTAFIDAVGSYSILYDSVDTAGNTATQIIRTVTVT